MSRFMRKSSPLLNKIEGGVQPIQAMPIFRFFNGFPNNSFLSTTWALWSLGRPRPLAPQWLRLYDCYSRTRAAPIMDGANTSYKAAEIHALAMAPAHSSHSRDPAIPMSRAGAPILAIVKCEWIKEAISYMSIALKVFLIWAKFQGGRDFGSAKHFKDFGWILPFNQCWNKK